MSDAEESPCVQEVLAERRQWSDERLLLARQLEKLREQ
jgi:hypothetical protein